MSATSAPRESIDVGDIRVTYLPDGEAAVGANALFPTGTAQGHFTGSVFGRIMPGESRRTWSTAGAAS